MNFGLLGESLKHSFSPLIHSYLGQYRYSLYEVAPNKLSAFMNRRDFDGINVTVPYKQAVIPYCDTLSPKAGAAGSVNTVLKDENGKLHGYNTDWYGFCEMLRRGGIDPKDKKVLVLGSGGASRTVVQALAGLGAGEVITVSRSGENNYGNVARHYDAQLIVNTTPVGMYPDNYNSPLPLSGFTRLAAVADIIYNPARTVLLLEARRLGAVAVNGLAMLAAQAEMASRLFLNVAERPGIVGDIIRDISKKTQNIALIGMPGCGKSTVGRVLAAMLGRQFADVDALIEQEAKTGIPQIFERWGEEGFRDIETRVLRRQAAQSGTVIATGGGVVTRAENLDALRQNSLVVYLRRGLGALATDGRPLSREVGILELGKKRLPLYRAWSDVTVPVQAAPELTAAKIMEAIA